jgi:superfamily II DNA or RNA helicase
MNQVLTRYSEFLSRKRQLVKPTGFSVEHVNSKLFDWQADIVRWALRVGRCDLFEQPGLGKTIQQLSWAEQVIIHGGVKRLLVLCPLAVAQQTKREAEKFGILVHVKVCREQSEVSRGITITNYERLHKFDLSQFDAVVLDESSILKGMASKTREEITRGLNHCRYKLPCTATPAPNDYMELGNHAEFTGVMSRGEMLSMFFVHDGGDTSKWRLRGHAEESFWKWMGEWSVMIRKPSDIGYPDAGFDLPPLHIHETAVENDLQQEGFLFALPAKTMAERRSARKNSTEDRVSQAAELANGSDKTWLIWCDLNLESELLAKSIPDAVEVRGSDSMESKEEALDGFSSGKIRVLVTKPTIAGFGMNWQHCSNMAFVGLSDSYEQFYQAVRRCWRFGQTLPVNVHVITSELEGAVVANIKRKEQDAEQMIDAMVRNMADITSANIKGSKRLTTPYQPKAQMELPRWIA